MRKETAAFLGAYVIFGLTSCDQTQETQPTPTAISQQLDSEVNLYYSTIKERALLGKGEIATEKTSTKWFNFSQRKFDEIKAKQIFEYFESLAKDQRSLQYRIGNQLIPFALGEKPRNKRVFFIVPENAPLPSWPNPNQIAPSASSTGVFPGLYVTFARTIDSTGTLPSSQMFTTPATASSRRFAVEACQISISISSLSTEVANLGQEIVCNSFGSAFQARQVVDYNTYLNWARGVLISDPVLRPDGSKPEYPLYVLSEKEFNEIPKIGSVID